VAEATWGGADEAPPIDWRMSAAIENVSRGGADLPEVTSLEGAVRAWQSLDADHRAAAVLTPEHPVRINAGEPVTNFVGDAIGDLARHLPDPSA
jgi:hypothetical protein